MKKNSLTPPGKGKILRVKTGYNPNSSSVGSQIPAFFAFAVGSGALTIFVLHILNAVDTQLRKKREAADQPKNATKNTN